MTDRATVADAIKGAPQQAAEALLAVQSETADALTMAAIEAVARLFHREPEDAAVDELERRGLLNSFALAMKARGVRLDDAEDVTLAVGNFPDPPLSDFLSRSRAFRCRVLVNSQFSGSGCLVGPSTVLTAWHVIARAWSTADAQLFDPIEIELSDGTRRRAVPGYFSTSTELEFQGRLPSDDVGFQGFNDVALVKLERPDGIRLGFAELPREYSSPRSRSAILLVHFPQGNDKGFGFGRLAKVRGVTSRWRHDVLTAGGSSGGPCFNTGFALVGLHQGRWAPDARLVPGSLFLKDIRSLIESDIAPPALWSLDGPTHGQLVIGRDLFFEAIAAATSPNSRIRGVRVKRRDLAQGTAGLAFSFNILTLALARNPGKHCAVRIGFDTQATDLLDDIRRRIIARGINIPAAEPNADAGARIGETTLEATINDRARVLTLQIEAAAERDQQLIWFVFDNPVAGLADGERFAFEAFVGATLRQPRLRLMMTGFETITTPGEEFANASMGNGDGAPGLVVEYFGVFNRSDVEQLLTRACRDFGVIVDPAIIADRTNQILQGVPSITGQYSTADLETVGRNAVVHLDYLKSLAGAGP